LIDLGYYFLPLIRWLNWSFRSIKRKKGVITDTDKHLFVERSMRGGSVFFYRDRILETNLSNTIAKVRTQFYRYELPLSVGNVSLLFSVWLIQLSWQALRSKFPKRCRYWEDWATRMFILNWRWNIHGASWLGKGLRFPVHKQTWETKHPLPTFIENEIFLNTTFFRDGCFWTISRSQKFKQSSNFIKNLTWKRLLTLLSRGIWSKKECRKENLSTLFQLSLQ
jgi:hypothetical protein